MRLRLATVLLSTTASLITGSVALSVPASAQRPASSNAEVIFREKASAVFLIELRDENNAVLSIGSAFVVGPEMLVTNAHVVRGGRPYLKTGVVALPLSLVRSDSDYDLAILRSPTTLEVTPLRLAAGEPSIGSPVFALGNPRGLERSISEGIISAVRSEGERRLLQITAPISPGSSGGPVLTADGVVVGVTVGYLEGGQNLNFAIPASAVRALLADPRPQDAFAAALDGVRDVLSTPGPSYSDSVAWARRRERQQSALDAAAALAATGADYVRLAVLADSASETERVARFAQQAMRVDRSLADTARALIIKQASLGLYFMDSTRTRELGELLAVADSQLSHRPRDTDALYFRSRVLGKLGRGPEAITTARRAVELGRDSLHLILYRSQYHGLLARFGSGAEDDETFAAMVKARQAGAIDWSLHAMHLRERELWERAGDAYAEAYRLSDTELFSRMYACNAGRMYVRGELYDQALATLRTCLAMQSTAQWPDTADMAYAHRAIAMVLNSRNVFAQAEIHARQALILVPGDAWAAMQLAISYSGQERPSEAAAAAEEAIRLSDGKFASMHFQAGIAYFDLKDWSRCSRAFQKAAELVPEDDTSALNAGLCLARQGFYSNAARWMEQALARNPKRADRADIQRMIAAWRR